MGVFSDSVSDWCKDSEDRLDATFARFVELVSDHMTKTTTYGGKLPHRTGNLMRSLLASTSAPPAMGGPKQQYAGTDIGLVTASLKFGQDVWLGFQANYAHRMNYGFKGQDSLGRTYNQEGFGFVEDTIANAPKLAAQAAAEIRAKAGI